MSAAVGVLPPALTKEIRALFPTYAAAFASIAIGCISSSYLLIALGLLGFAFGSVALGAQSFGLEYTTVRSACSSHSRSIGARCSLQAHGPLRNARDADRGHPGVVRRSSASRRLSSYRALDADAGCGVRVVRGAHADDDLPEHLGRHRVHHRHSRAAVGWTDVVGALRYGLENAAAIDRFRLLVFWRGMLLICALGAVAGWRMFMRLEIIEGDAHIQFPGAFRTSQSTAVRARAHWAWALVTKGLHVQSRWRSSSRRSLLWSWAC